MTDDILAHQRDSALSESTQLAVDCARYLGVMLVATDMGRESATLTTTQVHETTGLPAGRQVAVRNKLRAAGLLCVEPTDHGYALVMGDGR